MDLMVLVVGDTYMEVVFVGLLMVVESKVGLGTRHGDLPDSDRGPRGALPGYGLIHPRSIDEDSWPIDVDGSWYSKWRVQLVNPQVQPMS